MQRLFFLIPALMLLFVPNNSHAQRQDPYRWCAQYGGSDGDGGRNCGFVTLEQCRAAISGVGGDCQPNPFYTGPVGPIYGGPYPDERRAPRQRQRNYRGDRY